MASSGSTATRTVAVTYHALTFTPRQVLLASSLLGAILTAQAGLAFGFGRPIIKVLASRHTVIEALDILATR